MKADEIVKSEFSALFEKFNSKRKESRELNKKRRE